MTWHKIPGCLIEECDYELHDFTTELLYDRGGFSIDIDCDWPLDHWIEMFYQKFPEYVGKLFPIWHMYDGPGQCLLGNVTKSFKYYVSKHPNAGEIRMSLITPYSPMYMKGFEPDPRWEFTSAD